MPSIIHAQYSHTIYVFLLARIFEFPSNMSAVYLGAYLELKLWSGINHPKRQRELSSAAQLPYVVGELSFVTILKHRCYSKKKKQKKS